MGAVQWSAIELPPDLAAGEVHLWRTATLSRGEAHDASLLSQEERRRAERLRGVAERMRFVAGRATLRRILGTYVGQEPGALAFRYGRFGKPLLEEAYARAYRFSVTHAGDLLLIAITLARDVGVDVERIRVVRRHERIARRYFAPEVCARLDDIEPQRRTLGFLHAWTCLEAHAKAVGGGVYATHTHLPLAWPAAPAASIVREEGPGSAGRLWTVRVLHPAEGFVATVVTEGDGVDFRFLEVPSRRA